MSNNQTSTEPTPGSATEQTLNSEPALAIHISQARHAYGVLSFLTT